MNILGKHMYSFGASLLYGLGSLLIPKKKGLYAFRLVHDPKKFAGNIRALLEYATGEKEAEDLVLLANVRWLSSQLPAQPDFQLVEGSLRRFWMSLRAQYLLIDSYTGLYRYGRFSIIQLGHGAGYKNIGLLRDDLSNWRRRHLHRIYRNYKLVVASSPSNLEKKNASFGVKTAVITGLPRNDVFFNENKERVQGLKARWDLLPYSKIIGYAPTFRDFETQPPFSNDFWRQLQEELAAQEILFIIKKHPWDRLLEVPDQYQNIQDLSGKLSAEEFMMVSDWLVTDYSSIATDYALTQKPILIYAYDFEAYQKHCRSIYYDLEKVLPRPFLTSPKALLNSIRDQGWITARDTRESYVRFQEEFHSFRDGNSSARVWHEIKKL